MHTSINVIIYTITTLLLLVFSCSNKGFSQTKRIDNNQPNDKKIDVIIDTTTIVRNNIALEVLSTYYPDSSYGKEDPQFIYAIVKQQLKMYETTNDSILLDTIIPVKKIERNFKHLGKMEVLENVLDEIGWVIGDEGDFVFFANGFGGCFNCSESYNIISPDGEILYFMYNRRGFFTIKKAQISIEEILERFKLSISSSEYKMTIKPFDIFWQR